MVQPIYQAAIDRHTQLLDEAERTRLCRSQAVLVLELRLPASQRRGLRITLLRLLLWPSRLEVT